MDSDRFTAALRADGKRLAAQVGGAAHDLTVGVPTCPGWTLGDLLRHTGSVYHHVIASITLGRRARKDEWSHGPADPAGLTGWFLTAHEAIVDELARRDPAAPAWSWFPPDQTAGFWYRRMAHETVIHRVDAESALGDVTAVDDDLAVDGIDEVLERYLCSPSPWSPGDGENGATGRSVTIRTGDHVWRVVLESDRATLSRELGGADAVVCGEPSELLLYLWGRRPAEAVIREGDAGVAAAFRERLVRATQ